MSFSQKLLKKLGLATSLIALHASVSAAYRVETVSLPEGMSKEVSAVTFSPEGELFVATRSGEIWRSDQHARDWHLFASGLLEPLGLLVDSSSLAYVISRAELTRLEDTNGDGLIDTFITINDDWGMSGNYHAFAYGLKRDSEGNFFGGLGLDSGGERELQHVGLTRGPLDTRILRRESQWSLTRYRGWSFIITPEGKLVPWASGFRQPAGIGISPEDDYFSSDNQGDWVASSGLIHHKKDHFYGHPASLKWTDDDHSDLSDEELAQLRTPPAVILPHGALGGSPGEPIWDLTDGKFGPFAGQIFMGDFTPLISRIFLEKVDGEYQGAAFPFIRDPDLRAGNMRMVFSPEGALYTGQTTRGWGSGDGLQRIVWDGETPVEMQSVELQETGFSLKFTVPMNAETLAKADAYRVSRFRYLYHSNYGSPRIDEAPVEIVSIQVDPNNQQADLVLSELLPGFIYEIQLDGFQSASGKPMTNPTAYYTANRLRNGSRFTGPFTKPIEKPKTASGPKTIDLVAGKKTYLTYCVACHQPDGRGGGTAVADFVGDKSILKKNDTQLLRSIQMGTSGGMIPFGSVLSDEERQNVLGYIRENFGASD